MLARQRILLAFSLAVMVGLAWAYLAWMSADMQVGGGGALARCAAMPGMTSSRAAYLGWVFIMWAVMAVAMMLPTSLPLIFLFGRYWQAKHPGAEPVVPALSLTAGYLGAWLVFGLGAALLQWALGHAGWATPVMGELRNATAGGAVIVAAGVFQLTPLKTACLRRCRTPTMFLNTRWRDGRAGPFLMGLDDGLFCVGCCWALMLLMFVVGVMNLFWMAVLTVVMIAEKLVPRGVLFTRSTGVALIAVGVWRMLAQVPAPS